MLISDNRSRLCLRSNFDCFHYRRNRFSNCSLDCCHYRGGRCHDRSCNRRNNRCFRKGNGRSSLNFRHSLLAAAANNAAAEPFFINLLVCLNHRLKFLEIAFFEDTLVALGVDSGLMQTLNHLFVFKSELLGQFENFCLSHQYSPAILW